MKKTALVMMVAFAMGLWISVTSVDAFSRGTRRINAKQLHNARATAQGVRNGSLSVGERARLKVGRTATHNMTQRFKSDGRMGIGERLILNGRANRGNRAINHLTNN
jgi:hypothetical protein